MESPSGRRPTFPHSQRWLPRIMLTRSLYYLCDAIIPEILLGPAEALITKGIDSLHVIV